jgi:hypothetical protein
MLEVRLDHCIPVGARAPLESRIDNANADRRRVVAVGVDLLEPGASKDFLDLTSLVGAIVFPGG